MRVSNAGSGASSLCPEPHHPYEPFTRPFCPFPGLFPVIQWVIVIVTGGFLAFPTLAACCAVGEHLQSLLDFYYQFC